MEIENPRVKPIPCNLGGVQVSAMPRRWLSGGIGWHAQGVCEQWVGGTLERCTYSVTITAGDKSLARRVDL